MLVVQPDYTKMNIDALLYMLEHIEPKEYEKKEVLFDIIIKKYFEERENNQEFNIYSYIMVKRLGFNIQKIVAKIISILKDYSSLAGKEKEVLEFLGIYFNVNKRRR